MVASSATKLLGCAEISEIAMARSEEKMGARNTSAVFCFVGGERRMVHWIIAHGPLGRVLSFHRRKFLSNSLDNRPGARLSFVLQRVQYKSCLVGRDSYSPLPRSFHRFNRIMVNPKDGPLPASPSPFDDDEASPIDSDASDSARWFSKWIRPSGMVAAVSLAVAIIASVVSNNAAGDRNIEDLAYNVNRFASLVMLLGCFGLLIGFRGEQIVGWFTKGFGEPKSPTAKNDSPTIGSLIFRSIVVSIALATVITILSILSVQTAMIAMIAFYSLYFPLLVTSAVMRKGTARAFSIGMAANFQFLLVGYFGVFGVVWFQTMFWGPSRVYAPYSIDMIFWQKAIPVIAVCGTQALMISSGLICAWYAKALTQNKVLQVGKPDLTTLSPPPESEDRTRGEAVEFSVDPGLRS